jgi:TetR/AcrR family transcriptional repressor of nem operon
MLHKPQAARMAEGCELRGAYAEGARGLYETFMDAAKGSMTKDRARLLFAAMVGANMLGRAMGDAEWTAALRKTVKAAATE